MCVLLRLERGGWCDGKRRWCHDSTGHDFRSAAVWCMPAKYLPAGRLSNIIHLLPFAVRHPFAGGELACHRYTVAACLFFPEPCLQYGSLKISACICCYAAFMAEYFRCLHDLFRTFVTIRYALAGGAVATYAYAAFRQWPSRAVLRRAIVRR